MSVVSQFVTTWWEPISAGVGGVVGWYCKVAAVRMVQRRDQLDAGQQALQLVADARVTETSLRTTVAAYSTEIDALRSRRWVLDELVGELHAQAIAARLMVHDLERQLGRPQTEFAPLPVGPSDAGQAVQDAPKAAAKEPA